MRVFISWSKPLSQCVAGKLQKWLQKVFPHVDIFMSSEDIKTGARWSAEISKELESTRFGILVLTRENVTAPWIHFEAGALSKVMSESRVCPILVDINTSDIPGPLSQFMAARIDRDGILHLLKSINQTLEPGFQNREEWVDDVIDVWWPHLQTQIEECRKHHGGGSAAHTEQTPSERMLEQVLQYVRMISEQVQTNTAQQQAERSPGEIQDRCSQFVRSVVSESTALIKDYREELPILHSFSQAGITALYKNRQLGVSHFSEAIRRAKKELSIVGSSMKGLILEKEYEDAANLILTKSKERDLQLRFLLTHPCVADLRARQEKRNRMEIGREVIATLKTLYTWRIPEKCVKLYMGTPTCFGIKADDVMLLNPYPYGGVSYNSPCLIVQRKVDASGFFFDAFDASHFGVWESQVAVAIESYQKTIEHLEESLPKYSKLIDALLTDGT